MAEECVQTGEEPGALAAHAGICAGDRGNPPPATTSATRLSVSFGAMPTNPNAAACQHRIAGVLLRSNKG